MFFFFFNDTATTEIYTLSLHDALPISCSRASRFSTKFPSEAKRVAEQAARQRDLEHELEDQVKRHRDRKSTRLNSSHTVISYAVFCLKKKNITHRITEPVCTISLRHCV